MAGTGRENDIRAGWVALIVADDLAAENVAALFDTWWSTSGHREPGSKSISQPRPKADAGSGRRTIPARTCAAGTSST